MDAPATARSPGAPSPPDTPCFWSAAPPPPISPGSPPDRGSTPALEAVVATPSAPRPASSAWELAPPPVLDNSRSSHPVDASPPAAPTAPGHFFVSTRQRGSQSRSSGPPPSSPPPAPAPPTLAQSSAPQRQTPAPESLFPQSAAPWDRCSPPARSSARSASARSRFRAATRHTPSASDADCP